MQAAIFCVCLKNFTAAVTFYRRAFFCKPEQRFDKLYSADHDYLDYLMYSARYASLYDGALALAQTPLVLTATFADGTTQTKQYRVSPKENYVETMVERALEAAKSETFTKSDSDLYTIEEIL